MCCRSFTLCPSLLRTAWCHAVSPVCVRTFVCRQVLPAACCSRAIRDVCCRYILQTWTNELLVFYPLTSVCAHVPCFLFFLHFVLSFSTVLLSFFFLLDPADLLTPNHGCSSTSVHCCFSSRLPDSTTTFRAWATTSLSESVSVLTLIQVASLCLHRVSNGCAVICET